jgi:hypothetical protein
LIAALLAERPGPRDYHHAPAIPGCTASRHAPCRLHPPPARKARVHAVGRRSRPMPVPSRQSDERGAGKDWRRTGRKIRQRLGSDEGKLSRPVSRGGGSSNARLHTRPWVDANQQIEVPEKHHLGQVQADEIRVKTPGGVVWMALAMLVSTRLWLAGAVSAPRDLPLIRRLISTQVATYK